MNNLFLNCTVCNVFNNLSRYLWFQLTSCRLIFCSVLFGNLFFNSVTFKVTVHDFFINKISVSYAFRSNEKSNVSFKRNSQLIKT